MSDQEDLERQAAEGETQAMYELGVLFWESGDVESARGWHLQAAEGGHAQAMGRLGFIEGREGNQVIGRSWLEKAAEKGDVRSMYNLGVEASEDGDRQLAREWWEKAASIGDGAAMFNLGVEYHQENPQLARDWYEKAVNHGENDALLNLGRMAQDDGNYDTARRWYERADDAGDANAKFNLGVLDGLQGRYDTMREALEEAAAAGDCGAYFTLATFEEQNGDREAALEHYQRAAEGGVVEAMFNLGNNARRSNDYVNARKWWLMGGEHGDVRSAFALGRLESGEQFTDVTEQHLPDLAAAKVALTRATELGEVGAYGLLAQIAYDEGDATSLRRYLKAGAAASQGCYSIVNAEALTKDAPKDFYLPKREDRDLVEPGMSVKLIWEDSDGNTERMWCQVLLAKKSAYTGYLDNNPVEIEITRGTVIDFGPEHIVQVGANDKATAAILSEFSDEHGVIRMPAGMPSAEFAKFAKRVSQAGSYENSLKALGDLTIEAGDVATALDWYEQAAKLGNPDAMLALGHLADAEGDIETAERWWLQASGLGDLAALFQLGLLEKREAKARGRIPRRIVKAKGVSLVASAPLDGYTFVFTGALLEMTRDKAERAVRNQGANVASRVTDDTSFVVIGENAGENSFLATMSNAFLLDEQAFLLLLTDGVEKVVPAMAEPDVLDASVNADAFVGITFVLTGKLQSMARDEVEQAIRERGGKISSAVSKSTGYVVVGSDPGSKLAKAEKLGVPILKEEAFLMLIRQ